MYANHRILHRCLTPLLLLAATSAGDDRTDGDDVVVSFAMLDDPRMEFPPTVTVLPKNIVQLWTRTLDVSDTELQRQVATAIELAHRLGYADFTSAVPRLREILRKTDAPSSLRVSVATALLTLDDRESASEILELSRSAGPTLAGVAEPTLADWNFAPAIELWLARLDDEETPRSELSLAIDGLMAAEESAAVPALKRIALDSGRGGAVRLAAARSWGSLQRSGLEDPAKALVGDPTPDRIPERLVGASLLRFHDSTTAFEVLLDVAGDPEPAVAAIAWERLLEADSSRLTSIAEAALQNADARIRGYAVQAIAAHPTTDRLIETARLLSDPHVDVRNQVRRTLMRLAADAEFDQTIRDQAVRVLQEEDWRGLEQATILLAALDHDDAAPNLLALLDHPRTEVAVTAAWGLRVLAVPETLPSMLAFTEQGLNKDYRPRLEFLQQCAHLFEAFGLMKFHESERLLRRYVPKGPSVPSDDYSRSAAIWALGFLHEGEPDRGLTRELIGRLKDVESDEPESDFVRRFAAVTVGRMGDESALGSLSEEFAEEYPPGDEVDYACRWAVEQMTGTPFRQPVPYVSHSVNWFLVPLNLEEDDP